VRRPLGLVLLAGLAAVGCGGGGGSHASQAPAAARPATQAAQPIAQQLRIVLQGALHPTAGIETYTPPSPPIHANVRACSGPPRGRAGFYRCTLAPTGHGFAPRFITVLVKPDGTWSFTIPHDPRERLRSQRGVYGSGLHMPSR
jgi:hypothetical protein